MNDKKATYTVGQSGRKYWNEPEESPEDRQCRLDSEREFVEDEIMLAEPRVNFPDQGHPVSGGGFKESDGTISTPEPKHLTEWDEHD